MKIPESKRKFFIFAFVIGIAGMLPIKLLFGGSLFEGAEVIVALAILGALVATFTRDAVTSSNKA